MDTLPSADPNFLLRPAIRYSRFWIWHPSSERQRDFNPPEQCAAQRTLRRSPTSPARACPSCGDEPSRTGLRYLKACWRYPGSRACCFLACAGSNDYAGPNSHSRLTRLPVLPSSYSPWSRHPDLRFFEAQSPGPPMPRSTLRHTPHGVPRKTRGQDGFATSFPVGLLHPLQHAGLSRRTAHHRLFTRLEQGLRYGVPHNYI